MVCCDIGLWVCCYIGDSVPPSGLDEGEVNLTMCLWSGRVEFFARAAMCVKFFFLFAELSVKYTLFIRYAVVDKKLSIQTSVVLG